MNEISIQMIMQGKVLSEEFLGEGYEQRFWYLDALYVDETLQGRGLGTKLLEWAVGEVGKFDRDIVDGGGETRTKAEGVWVLSSEAGVKIYENCGFVKVSEKVIPKPLGEGEYFFGWYLKKL